MNVVNFNGASSIANTAGLFIYDTFTIIMVANNAASVADMFGTGDNLYNDVLILRFNTDFRCITYRSPTYERNATP